MRFELASTNRHTGEKSQEQDVLKTKSSRIVALCSTLVVGILAASTTALRAKRVTTNASAPPLTGRFLTGDRSSKKRAVNPLQPIVSAASRQDRSPSLHQITPIPPRAQAGGRTIPSLPLPRSKSEAQDQSYDLVRQTRTGVRGMPAPDRSFEGIANVDDVQLPDAQGDVGPHHYVQWVNLSFAIWDKAGNVLYGPASGNTLWAGFGGPCETTNDGDPITLYDALADRWFMSQFALPLFPDSPFYQCIAVSESGDPTGAWFRYEFLIPVEKLNDYPKFGVWPDGYYMSVNQFSAETLSWAGAGAAVFERDAMLNGKLARMIYFDTGAATHSYGGMLPADLDGSTPPPPGSPNYFVEWDDSTKLGDAQDTIRLWEFHVNWTKPSNATFGLANHAPNAILATANVDPNMCDYSRECIPQPGTSRKLDAISDRLMYRLQYRNFGTHETLITNHTVDVDGTDHTGIHWFELRKRTGSWSIHQDGVHTPDGDHRWMGSIAMDGIGNTALGYSVVNDRTFSSIRYAGRLTGDPLGTMHQGEVELIAGTGSQTEFSGRWGDYSMMAVEPADDCTFWYTQEYYRSDGSNWQTRIGAFRFLNCTSGPRGTLTGVIFQDSGTPQTTPLAEASLAVTLGPTQTVTTTTGPDGRYTISLPAGSHDVTALAYGHQLSTINAVNIISGTTTTLNIPLTPVDTYVVSGTAADANSGWPLYARIKIQSNPVDPPSPHHEIWTNPVSGYNSVTLASGVTHTLDIEAWVPAYSLMRRDISPLNGDQTQNWAVEPDPTTCTAPGYSPADVYTQDFETGDGGYSHAGSKDEWEWGTPTAWPRRCAPDSRCRGTDLNGDYARGSDQSLYSPIIDLSHIPPGTPLTARWWQAWAIDSATYDLAFVEISINGERWTKIWHGTGSERPIDWTAMSHDVSVAAGGTAQLRWRLISDTSGNREGLYLDDVSVSAGCIQSPGGLIVGNVYDKNTRDPLVGASVSTDSGDQSIALSTPDDPAVQDGFYTLFSPAGAHVLTAEMNRYGTATADVAVLLDSTIQQDLYVPAGRLTYLPSGMAATVDLGHSIQVPFRLKNEGTWPASFELQDVATGSVSSQPSRDALFNNTPVSVLLVAAADVVQIRTMLQAYPDIDAVDFFDARLATPPLNQLLLYDTVVVMSDFCFSDPVALGNRLAAYIDNGGTVVQAVPTFFDPIGCWSLQGRYASEGYSPFTGSANWFSWAELGPFDASHPIMRGVTTAGDDLRQVVGLTPGAELVAEWTDDEFVATKGSVVALNTFLADGFDWVGDVDLIVHNSVVWLVSPDDATWLSESPTNGTLAASAERKITVTFDASVPEISQPGAYHAQIDIDTDTPYKLPSLPVTMTVSPPATWGKLQGTVSGLGYCDAAPVPIEGATVLITDTSDSTWELTTDFRGMYSLWFEQGSFSVSASAHDHLPYATVTTVTAQSTTTKDFDLRVNQPCISIKPPSMNATLIPGALAHRRLSITNSGAGSTTFRVIEQERVTVTPPRDWPNPDRIVADGQFQENRVYEATSPETRTALPSVLSAGGPDGFGYTFRDSNETDGPKYNWIEIAPPAGGSGTALGLTRKDDAYFWPLSLPFSFNFYGKDYAQLAVATNGVIYFEDKHLGLVNRPIPKPNAYGVETFIAHFWDDLVVFPGDVYFLAQNEMFIIEYYQTRAIDTNTDHGTWQVILYADGNILFQYRDASVGGLSNFGASATVGIQGDASTGLQYAYNTPALSDGLAICFAYPDQSTDCIPTAIPWILEEASGGTLNADSTRQINVKLTASPDMTSGVHTAALEIRTQDTRNPRLYIPITLMVPEFWRYDLAFATKGWAYRQATHPVNDNTLGARNARDILP